MAYFFAVLILFCTGTAKTMYCWSNTLRRVHDGFMKKTNKHFPSERAVGKI